MKPRGRRTGGGAGNTGRGSGGGRGRGGGGPRRGEGMRGGGGRGRGRGRRRHGANFLRPGLLALLYVESGHGYNLLQGLSDLGIDTEVMDPSVVYRALRDMEEDGLVKSQWGDESLGPRRRVYSLTGDGEDALGALADDLERTRDRIDRILSAIRAQGRSENK